MARTIQRKAPPVPALASGELPSTSRPQGRQREESRRLSAWLKRREKHPPQFNR